jgi:assimilatory nitrate reductase electron transfer subunit
VLAGTVAAEHTQLHPAGWARQYRITVHLGQPVRAVDLARRQVHTAGDTFDYDELVLATGSRANLPAVPGLAGPDGMPADGVAVLRTLSDCRRIAELAGTGEIAVLGGGVLGLEAARALATRGHRVTVIHPPAHLMNRQLDEEAGGVLAHLLRQNGMRVRLGESAKRWEPGLGLTTNTGELLPCRAVLVATGAAADTTLAAAAGLTVDGGIVVDDRLATSAPHVWSLGDCARHAGAPAGFVQPAWEQAAVLADLLTGADLTARYRGTRLVTRLKDRDIHLAAVGETDPLPVPAPCGGWGDEVVRFSDPVRGRYAKLVVRDDRVAGAIMLGLPDAAATVVQLYDRDVPVPADRLAVLLGRAAPVVDQLASAPERLSEDSVVCRCNTVTKAQLTTAWRAGATDVAGLASRTRATTGCGGCEPTVEAICTWLRSAARPVAGDAPDTAEAEGAA